MVVSTRIDRFRQLVSSPVKLIQAHISPEVLRLIWRALSALSLTSIALASYYAWRSLPQARLAIRPEYLILAIGIYTIAYTTHLLGWHALATWFFGRLSFNDNVYAIASSSFVKYLPTVAWYIANRTHFYTRRGIPVKSVVAASLAELIIMTITGGFLFLIVWLIQRSLMITIFVVGIGVITCIAIMHNINHRHWRPLVPRQLLSLTAGGAGGRGFWFIAMAWYGLSWLLGVAILWAVLSTFVPLSDGSLLVIFNAWMITGIASYILTLSLGTAGIARDITLVVLLANVWPLPIAITTAIIVKMLLMVGEISCSGLLLGWFWVMQRRKARA